MAQTYAQLQKEIAELEAKAAKLKQAEVAEVIEKVKEAIAVYGLTAQDLFGSRAAAGKRGSVKAKTKSKQSDAAKYADSGGNTWVGRGPRPQWLRDALAAGKSLSDFEVGGKPTKASAARKAAPKKRGKSAGRAKFKDDAGNSWTGRGKRPTWFKDALASGKSPEDLMA
jgi:DNA-binding protein H-NS